MTTGIYRLNFASGNFYIGKSVNMEVRWQQHQESMQKGKAAANMQAEYNIYGFPDPRIVFTCHPDYLDILEGIEINARWGPNILNTTRPPYREFQDEVDVMVYEHTQSILQHSVPMVIKVFIETQTKLDELRATGIQTPQEIKDIERENRILVKRLETYENLSLFSRIFNYPKFRDYKLILKHFQG